MGVEVHYLLYNGLWTNLENATILGGRSDTAPIRVSATQNGFDRSGREGSNRAKDQRVVGTGLSGFEIGNSGWNIWSEGLA